MEESDLVMSSFCQSVERDGRTVRVEIYSSGKNDWILEVVNESGDSTIWNDTFNTDQLAIEEFRRTLDREGIQSF